MDFHEECSIKDPSEIERTKKVYFDACEEYDSSQIDQFIEIIEGSSSCGSTLVLKGNLKMFHKNKLKDNDFHAMFVTLQTDSCIRKIDLSYNSLSADVCVNIGKALVKNKSIKRLDLTMCDIDVDGCYAISKGLEYNFSLKKLILSGNKFGPDGAVALANVLQINDSLKSLHIASTNQTSQSLIPLCTVLTRNTSVQYLDVSRTVPYTDGQTLTDHFSKLLTINMTLASIKLSKCDISDHGASSLAYYLKSNTTLKHLDLSSNKIFSDGAKAFADLLSINSTLEELSLCLNKIGDIGMIAISEVLARRNTGLKKLWVTNNAITDSGICALAAALHTNKSLTHLYLWGNKIHEGACNAFQILCSGDTPRMSPENIDIKSYVVDGVNYLAETGQFAWSH